MRQQLVVLRDAVAARGCPVLIWPQFVATGEVGDRRVLRLAAAVAHHARVAVRGRELDGVERLGERADLVDLDEHAVRDARSMPIRRRATFVTNRSSPTS
jgi:hypothetical protein